VRAYWRAPEVPDRYWVTIDATNERGGTTTRRVGVEVIGGTLLIQTRDGLYASDLTGNDFEFSTRTGPIELLGTRIFVGNGNIVELDHAGEIINILFKPRPMPFAVDIVMLEPEYTAYLNSEFDEVYFMDFGEGDWLTEDLPEQSPDVIQHMSGLLDDDRLIVSETGTGKLVQFDVETLQGSLLRDLSAIGELGPLALQDGTFYMGVTDRVYYFFEQGELVVLAIVEEEEIGSIAVAGRHVYFTATQSGRVYRTHTGTGDTEVLIDGLDEPRDIEFLPADLEAPGL
jgi:hypothetical protein